MSGRKGAVTPRKKAQTPVAASSSASASAPVAAPAPSTPAPPAPSVFASPAALAAAPPSPQLRAQAPAPPRQRKRDRLMRFFLEHWYACARASYVYLSRSHLAGLACVSSPQSRRRLIIPPFSVGHSYSMVSPDLFSTDIHACIPVFHFHSSSLVTTTNGEPRTHWQVGHGARERGRIGCALLCRVGRLCRAAHHRCAQTEDSLALTRRWSNSSEHTLNI
jgi:hypothetical protein